MAYSDPDEQREYQRRWIANRRSKYVALHGGQCVRCSATDGLEFDHVNGGDKVDHRIWSWKESRIELELEKCQLLCRQCHRRKTTQENYPARRHGTNLMYQKGCVCSACKAAHALVNRMDRRYGIVVEG